MTTTEKADKVLAIVYEKSTIRLSELLYAISSIRENTPNGLKESINPVEAHAIVKLLHYDSYISVANMGNVDQVSITIRGSWFIEKGGYRQAIASKEQLETLQREQLIQNKVVARLTYIIAFGTLISAIYYILEILKAQYPMLNIQFLTALFLLLAGCLIGCCVILLVYRAKEKVK